MEEIETTRSETITLNVRDHSGQREFTASDVPTDASWGEVMESVIASMDLPRNNPDGETVWGARLDREQRRLNPSEIVADALLDRDTVTMLPETVAGRTDLPQQS